MTLKPPDLGATMAEIRSAREAGLTPLMISHYIQITRPRRIEMAHFTGLSVTELALVEAAIAFDDAAPIFSSLSLQDQQRMIARSRLSMYVKGLGGVAECHRSGVTMSTNGLSLLFYLGEKITPEKILLEFDSVKLFGTTQRVSLTFGRKPTEEEWARCDAALEDGVLEASGHPAPFPERSIMEFGGKSAVAAVSMLIASERGEPTSPTQG